MSNEVMTAFKAMQTDIQISMDDVVSAFVSQYENNLYQRKKELTAEIKEVEVKHKKLEENVLAKADGSSFDVVLPYNLVCKVGDGTINWKKARVDFKITIMLKGDRNSYYSNSISLEKNKPILASHVKAHKNLQEELTALRADLSEVLVSLKSVARKEREVRGRIAVRKLEDSGYADLMKDSELAQLVQLD